MKMIAKSFLKRANKLAELDQPEIREEFIFVVRSALNVVLYLIISWYVYFLLQLYGVDWSKHFIEWCAIILLSAFISVGITRILEEDYLYRQWVKEMQEAEKELKEKLEEGKGVVKIYDVSEISDDNEIIVSAKGKEFVAKGKGRLYLATIFIPEDEIKEEHDR